MMATRSIAASEKLYKSACDLMPGGVNSPVRAFRAVGGTPIYFSKGKGSKLWDVDGNEYIDYVCSWGAILLGHADARVTEAVSEAASRGTSFGAPCEAEIDLAELVIDRIPSIEMVRFVNSGSEANMGAIRLARAATGRSKLIKFAGNYHGAIDSLLAKSGSGVATFGLPDSAGVPASVTRETYLVNYNDADGVERIFQAHPGGVAAMLVEPVAGNMGLVPPEPGFLEKLRKLCDDHGSLLILDEVMTGFRVGMGGASTLFGVHGDITVMGKVIGGGLPVGAYGANRKLMEMVAPVGPVYQAGTLSGNPLAMAGGFAALSALESKSYDELEKIGSLLQSGLKEVFENYYINAQVQRVGSMISVFFTSAQVLDFETAQTTDRMFFGRLFNELLSRGIYLPPSALESWFISLSHSESDIDRTVQALSDSLKALSQ